jgi:hypothetical protein
MAKNLTLLKLGLVTFTVLSWAFTSCIEKNCFFPKNAKLILELRLSDTSSNNLDTILSVRGLGRIDSMSAFRYSESRIGAFLDQTSDSCALVYRYRGDLRSDTITLRYRREIGISSTDCGYITFFKDITIAKSSFPKTVLLRNETDTSSASTIRAILK